MNLISKLAPLKARYEELASLMSSGGLSGEVFVKLSREYAELEPVVEAFATYQKALTEQADLSAMMDDPEMKDMAEAEFYALKEKSRCWSGNCNYP